MRGARHDGAPDEGAPWIIPAYAGSTYTQPAHLGSSPDHPRVCGEHSESIIRDALLVGSSPRMRGARCALSTHALFGDHPRVCGEHAGRASAYISVLGSSPRMRGARCDM